MDLEQETYDVGLVGGGLAGLALSILLARSGYRVALFEKEKYPFHKVCGEYISFESWNFLEDLGIPLSDWNLPVIRRLLVSAPNGNHLEQDLPLGGFGLSRYRLDAFLAELAKKAGVVFFEQTRVNDVVREGNSFNIHHAAGLSYAKIVCGTFGKRSNLDVKWKRENHQAKKSKLDNYVGVKYHILADQPEDLIVLHNFQNGYCGLSQIEDGKHCLCYLTSADNLAKCGNSIAQMESDILRKNPFIDKIFTTANFIFRNPVTISQISFAKKDQVGNHILFVGDAAGMITPLCGNGMSMALHGAKIAFDCMLPYLQGKLSREQMEAGYSRQWHKIFAVRLRTGRVIQRFFGDETFSNILIGTVKPYPRFFSFLVRKTHGGAF
ncbi:MAG TPA: NAD(P)/FAD-dependent oxidoreductase [Puia sp.]|nr:NAD(P)/FAD-dependent oxidoreductase [Puia sp.]